MKAFEFASPDSVADALKALAGAKDATVLSGGVDLVNRMKDYIDSPSRVVSVNQIKELSGIRGDASGGVTIGAATRIIDLLNNPAIKQSYPAVWASAADIGTPQIRNMSTVGGNLLQRPSCWYYRNGFGLLGVKDGKSLVRTGDNRYHAIFHTDGDALFVNPSMLAAALIAFNAQATIVGANGKRTVAVAELYRVPRTNEDRELTVAQGEILTEITLPGSPGKSATYIARERAGEDWPLLTASSHIQGDKARIVLFGAAPIPYRCEAAEKAIAGKEINTETAAAAAEAAAQGAKPLSMNGYKVSLVKTAVKRSLLSIVGQRYWEEG